MRKRKDEAAQRSKRGTRLVYIYLYLDKGPRGLWGRLRTRGTLNFAAIYYTLATLACVAPRLGRSRGRMGVPELPKSSFGTPK